MTEDLQLDNNTASTKWINGIKKEIEKVRKSNKEARDEISKAYEQIEIVSTQIGDLLGSCSTIPREIIIEIEKVKRDILKKLKTLKLKNDNQKTNISKIETNADNAVYAIKTDYEEQRYDELTGLFNNKYYNNLINLLTKEKKEFHLVFIDLDNFKPINDTYGHQSGDFILYHFASLLVQIFGENRNSIFRKQGDEFAILSLDSIDEINKKLKKLQEWINTRQARITHKGKSIDIKLSFSYGIASSRDGKNNPDKIYEISDQNMYKMKKNKKID